jgi:uncharacterized protein Usg
MIVTAEILYFMPDHPRLLQSFIWQDFDRSPEFPKLKSFLEFWDTSIEGKVHSVYIAEAGFLKEYEVKHANWSTVLH